MNILCDTLSEKKQLLGDFSDDVIQAESRIGAIYLCECEYLNAAEHLREVTRGRCFVFLSDEFEMSILVPWFTRICLWSKRSSNMSNTRCIGNLEEVDCLFDMPSSTMFI